MSSWSTLSENVTALMSSSTAVHLAGVLARMSATEASRNSRGQRRGRGMTMSLPDQTVI